MSYFVYNTTSPFDPVNAERFDTQEAADARAKEVMAVTPQAVVHVAELLGTYTAQVSVSVAVPEKASVAKTK
jgi:hypothetical protein